MGQKEIDAYKASVTTEANECARRALADPVNFQHNMVKLHHDVADMRLTEDERALIGSILLAWFGARRARRSV